VLGAGPSLPSGPNFACIVDVAPKQVRIFVIDLNAFVCAELANFHTGVKTISSIVAHFISLFSI
jgi:hypothetical protein